MLFMYKSKDQHLEPKVCGMMASDSSDCVDFRGYEHKADSHKVNSFAESTRAREDGILEPPELHTCYKYDREELHLTPCDW